MSVIDVLSWLAVVLVLVAYALSPKRPRLFDWANAALFIPVALPAILAGAFSSAAISVAFGLIAIVNLVHQRKGGTL